MIVATFVLTGVAAAVWTRRRKKFTPECTGGQFVVRKSIQPELDYSPALPTLTVHEMRQRVLFTEPETGRFALELVLGPNQHYPAHLHGSAEWLFVIQGEFLDQHSTKRAGDFFYNEKNSPHYHIRSGEEGCILLAVKDKGSNPPQPHLDQAVSCPCGGNAKD
ncbi:hypothetical protein BASA81_007940 [Batrachochytrium salamandrivorans]|nr:hypothetical protein BASA81_007940 [Batrachochytrium salamandrivorans]